MTSPARPDRAYQPQPMGLRLESACAYVGLGKTKFLELVETGDMPRPRRVGRVVLWARIELDACFLALPTGEDDEPDTWEDVA